MLESRRGDQYRRPRPIELRQQIFQDWFPTDEQSGFGAAHARAGAAGKNCQGYLRHFHRCRIFELPLKARGMNRSKFFVAALILMTLVGCRAKPAPDAGFLQDAHLMKKDKTLPFNRVYLADPDPASKYTEIYVAPVDISHLLPQNNVWEWGSTAYLFPEDVKKNYRQLADYTRSAFIRAIQKDKNHRFTVVESPGPRTLILEMSLVQIIPAKPALN